MKSKTYLIWAAFWLSAAFANGQGVALFDQQSTNLIEGSAPLSGFYRPVGQSFTPALSSVGFVTLMLYDGDALHISSGNVHVNLRANSITGPILGTSLTVSIPDNFFDVTNFSFALSVAVIPGTTYYFEPEVISGNPGIGSYITDASYTGGSEILEGVPLAGRNLWFCEGIYVVPEPPAVSLVAISSGLVLWAWRRRNLAP